MLGSSSQALCEAYDLAMLDLDGVVYVGGEAVPGAAEHLASVRERGMHLAFITNNASRTPAQVATHLHDLGVQARAEDVVTSAQAAARVLTERFGSGSRVARLGADGLEDALTEQGLVPVGVEEEAEAIVTGYGPEVPWGDIMRAAVRIRDGLPWVASNTDMTFPAPFGLAPGHGVQVAMLRSFTGVDPVVAGKPASPLLEETVRRVGGRRPLMVGDRLDTDIEGAHNSGYDSLLVLTGVTGLPELATAPEKLRPTYVAPGLDGLLVGHEAPARDGHGFVLGGWRAEVDGGRLCVGGDGDESSWWRVVASATWAYLDATGNGVDLDDVRAPGR